MRKWFYIMASKDLMSIHVGYSKELKQTLMWYNAMPRSIKDGSKMNSLVYLEEYTQEENAIQRVKEVTSFTLQQKKKLIETINPDYIELVPGVNIEI